MKKILSITIVMIVIAGFGVACQRTKEKTPLAVTNFEECVQAGNPVMESYPRQCRSGDVTFTENIENGLDKTNLIRLDSPRPNQVVQSPLTVTGEARGFWFFEASFPVVLTNWDGLIISQGIATAQGEWMTEEFVPFKAVLEFDEPTGYSNRGTLILRKDNPSGLPEYDDALEIPVILDGTAQSPVACTQEAKQCPDGSYVGRTGPNCEFEPCPTINPKPAPECQKDSDCTAGNVCYKNSCTNPIGSQCNGPSDTGCPEDFECVQECGPPVVRYPDDTPLSYFCQLKGYNRPCPICLSEGTWIDTPRGAIPVQEIQQGAPVWTMNASGKRVAGVVIKTGKTPTPPNHKMVELVLGDGRTLLVSPGHPMAEGGFAEDLVAGDLYGGVRIVSSKQIPYDKKMTYDILPSGETGFYWANGIPLGSTLRQ